MTEDLVAHVVAALVLSLRIAPALAFAPPFTMLRIPAPIRVALAVTLAGWLVWAHPEATIERLVAGEMPIAPAMMELLLGIALAVSLQLAFAAIQVAGRMLDIQVGFALAQIADPTLRTQMPLVGAFFAYAAAAVFFASDGPADLLAIWAQSLAAMPLGAFSGQVEMPALLAYISAVFVLGLGLAAAISLVLLLTDIAVALLSRTLPQMNVLVLGFQVKTLVLLMTLPLVLAASGALLLRIVRLAINAAPQLI